MTTNRDVVHLFRTYVKENNGDRYLSDRAILADLIAIRNVFVKREIDRRKLIDIDSIYTNIPCLEMISVPLAECCSYKSPCNIRRSKYPLPKVGESIWGYIVEGVWNVDGSMSFTKGSAKTYANLKDLTDKNPNMYWIQNNYIYVSDPDIEILRLRLFLEDFEFNPELFKCSEEFEDYACMNPMDDSFKCPGYLVQGIVDAAVQKYLSTTRVVQNDTTDNDSQTPN